MFFFISYFTERELAFTFALCRRPSVCLPSVCPSVVCNVRDPYSGDEIFGSVSTPFNVMEILRRSSQMNLSVSGVGQEG